MMITRSLYEDVIAAYWAVLPENRATVLQKVLRQSRLVDELVDEAAAEVTGRATDPWMTSQELDELKKEFANGTKSWFGRLPKAKEQIEGEWVARGGSITSLNSFHRLLYLESNLYAHTTANSMISGATRHDGLLHPTYGFAEVPDREIRTVIAAGGWLFGQVAKLVLSEFDIPCDDLDAARAKHLNAVEKLMPSDRRSIGRNDPCWCGSGKKLKHCHES